MRLTYLPTEDYKCRQSHLMACPDGWAETVFKKRFSSFASIRPNEANQTQHIKSGSVLDRVRRPVWAYKQLTTLLESEILDLGKLYFDDFYHSGIDGLAYSGKQFQAYSFCWAQTFDIYDFTQEMLPWMRPYELMNFAIYSKVFVACPMLKELIYTWSKECGEKVEVVGLPFDSSDVAKRADLAYECPKYDIVFTSRCDVEKQLGVFLDVVSGTGVKAAICTGHEDIRGNDSGQINRALKLESLGRLDIHRNLSKGQYYTVLSKSHVQFNSALQDWVSYTLLEALTFGCVPLYPNFRAMPETLSYQEDNLYVPFSPESAVNKLKKLLDRPRHFAQGQEILEYHDNALKDIAGHILND